MGRWLVKDDKRIYAPDSQIKELVSEGWKLGENTIVETETGLRAQAPEAATGTIATGQGTAESTGAGSRGAELYNKNLREGLTNGAAQTVQAFGEGGVNALTLGLAAPALRNIEESISGDPGLVATRAEEHPYASTAGAVAGTVVGGLGGLAERGGASLLAGPLGLASRGATAVGEAATTAARGSKLAGAIAEGATEGFIFGGAQSVSNTLLHDKPLSAEAIVSEMGTGALLGAATGGVLGAAGLGLNKWANRFKPSQFKALHEGFDATSDFSQAVNREVTDAFRGQVIAGQATAKAVKRLETEFAESGAGRFSPAVKAEVSDDLAKINKAFGRDEGANFTKRIDSWTPDNIDVRLKEITDAQEALQKINKNFQLENEVFLLPTDLKSKITDAATAKKLPVEELDKLVEALKSPGLADRLGSIPSSELTDGLKTAWALRQVQKISNGAEKVTTDAGRGILGRAINKVTGGSAPFGAITGAAVGGHIGALVGGAAGATVRVTQAISNGVKSFVRAAAGSGKVTRPAVIAILEGSLIDAGKDSGAKERGGQPQTRPDRGAASVQKAFQSTAKALRRVAADPRALEVRLRAKFAPLAFLDPEIADSVVQHALKRAAYLNDHLPSTSSNNPFNQRERIISEAELHAFARKLDAANDPANALLREMEQGRLTSDTVETVKELSPEIFLHFQQSLINEIVENPQQLPYQKRIQLSIFFDIPADETMNPDFVKRMRENYIQRESESSPESDSYSTPNQVGSPVGVIEQPTAVQAIQMK